MNDFIKLKIKILSKIISLEADSIEELLDKKLITIFTRGGSYLSPCTNSTNFKFLNVCINLPKNYICDPELKKFKGPFIFKLSIDTVKVYETIRTNTKILERYNYADYANQSNPSLSNQKRKNKIFNIALAKFAIYFLFKNITQLAYFQKKLKVNTFRLENIYIYKNEIEYKYLLDYIRFTEKVTSKNVNIPVLLNMVKKMNNLNIFKDE